MCSMKSMVRTPSLFLLVLTKNHINWIIFFIPKDIKLVDVKVGDKNEIFNTRPRLSDHLPIVATLEI